MFTGIIEKMSTVERVSEKNDSLFVHIKRPRGWVVKNGMSIGINGVCSTVKKTTAGSFEVEYMQETVKKTTVGSLIKHISVNLERCLKAGAFLDGHIVQGHVDCTGTIKDIKPVGDSKIVTISVPVSYIKYIVPKGSITVDGISLTVVDIGKDWFTVSLVHYTLDHTTLGKIGKGAAVNIEVDILAKYIESMLQKRGV